MIDSGIFSFLLLVFFTLSERQVFAQNNLEYYLAQAHTQNAFLQNSVYQQQLADLEIQKIQSQFEKPQWSLSGDYLLAPYFFNNGKVLAITPNPDAKAIGYDAGVSNGGWYSAQVNLDYQPFSKKQSHPLIQQQELAQLGVQQQAVRFEADLKKQITAAYLDAYLLQQQMEYARQIKTRLQEQVEWVRKLADRGLMRLTDLELLLLEIKKQDYLLHNLALQYRAAIGQLNTTAGMVDTTFVHLDKVTLEIKDTSSTSVFLGQYGLDSLNAANDQTVFETRYLPQVNVFANGGLNAVALSGIYRKIGVSAGIHFSWLLRDGGQKEINAQQNEIRQLMAGKEAHFAAQQIQNSRQNLEWMLQNTQRNIPLLQDQEKAYQQLMTSYHQELALGQVSVIDYLNVLRTYADLQQQMAESETQVLQIINEINYWNN